MRRQGAEELQIGPGGSDNPIGLRGQTQLLPVQGPGGDPRETFLDGSRQGSVVTNRRQ